MKRRDFIITSVLTAVSLSVSGLFYFGKSDSTKRIKFLTTGRYIPHLDIHLTEHCNLNCKYCYHFSCIAEEEYTDFDKYEKDMKRLSEFTGGKIKVIALLGGEPLLHPRVTDFLTSARKYFPYSQIQLVTNGLLLNSMNDDFWQSLHDNSVILNLSPYPVNVDVDACFQKLNKYAIIADKTALYIKKNPIKKFAKFGLHPDGEMNYVEMFKRCKCLPQCLQLVDGKLFHCPVVAYIRHFNKMYNFDIPVTEADFFDIYKENSLDDFLNFFANPIPFCRYCVSCVGDFPWESSVIHDAEEWLDVRESFYINGVEYRSRPYI